MSKSEQSVPKGYKQTEVGVIPLDWKLLPVHTFCTIRTGPFGTLLKASEYSKGDGVPLISVGEIRDGFLTITSETPRVACEVTRRLPQYLLKEGDIVFGRKGGVNRSSLINRQQEGWFLGSDGMAVRPSEGFCNKFVSTQLRSDRVQTWLLQHAIGTTMPSLNQHILGRVVIPLPPTLAEQEAIASALSDADGLIESLEKLIAKKRQIKHGTMQELLTGNRRLPGFTGKWETKLLSEVCLFRGGKAHEQYICETGDYICVNSKFISTDGKQIKYSSTNFCKAGKNDILMVMSDLPNGRALAKAFLVDKDHLYAVNQRVCALTPIRDDPRFLFYALNRNPYFLKFDDGVGQTHLLNPVFQKCPIRLPASRFEQTDIATILADMDGEIVALKTKLSKARQVKQGMMQELLTGRVRLV